MKVIYKNIYTFDELENTIKDRAIDNIRNLDIYGWHVDNVKSLEAFCDVFPVKVVDFEYGYYKYINFNTTINDGILELQGIRLYKYIINNYWKYICQFESCACPFTGYCMDNDILDPIYKFLEKPNKATTFYNLLKECLESWVSACDDDYHATYEDENIIEFIQINGYEFDENGNIA